MGRRAVRFWAAVVCVCAAYLPVVGCGGKTQEAAEEVKDGAGELVDEFTGKRAIDRGEQIKKDLAKIQKEKAARENPDSEE